MSAAATTLYTWEEIRKHNSDKDCWVVLYDNVLDVTKFLNHHPGGLDPINDLGGYNITNSFESIGHSEYALNKTKEYIIGKLDPASQEPKVVRKPVAQGGGSVQDFKTFRVKTDPLAGIKKVIVAIIVILLAAYFYS
jgi:cytochrome b5